MTDLIAEDIFDPGFGRAGVLDRHVLADRRTVVTPEPSLLPRPRLIADLQAARGARLTIVRAPAGFGKSSLIRQWRDTMVAERRHVVTIAVGRQGAVLTDSLRRPATVRLDSHAAIAPVVEERQRQRGETVLIIDDWHLLAAELADSLIDRIISGRDSGLHVVLGSRHPPRVALARARALGQVVDIDARALCFTRDEAAELLRSESGVNPDAATLADLIRTSEGWPFVLRLEATKLRAGGRRDRQARVSGESRLVQDFFLEEILGPQPQPLQDFLIRTALLDRLDADLCDAVIGRFGSADLLEQLEQAGLFLDAVDDQRGGYRYHPLFAQFLRAQLRRRLPGDVHSLAIRAADWLELKGWFGDAAEQAIEAGAFDRAADILSAHCFTAYCNGVGHGFASLMLRLPRRVLRKHPKLLLYAAQAASVSREFGVAEDLLSLVAEHMRAASGQATSDGAQLDHLVLHKRMLMAQAEDDQPAAERKCVELVRNCDSFDPYTRGTIYGSLLYARREQFKLTDTNDLEGAGIREFNRCNSPYGLVWHLSVVGPTRFVTGDLAGAARRLDQAVALATAFEDQSWLAELPGPLLAEVCYERDDLDRSRDLLARHFPSSARGFVDQYVAGYLTDARLKALRGDVEAADARLVGGLAVAEQRNLDRLRQNLITERIRLMLRFGLREEALRIGQEEGLLVASDSVKPRADFTTRDEARAFGWMRLAIARGAAAEAAALAQRWLRFAAQAGAVRSVIRWEILLARACLAGDDERQAQRVLRSAVGRAAPGEFIRSFLDEGSDVVGLLRGQLEASPICDTPADRFLARLLADRADPSPGPAAGRAGIVAGEHGALTARQIDILRMAGAGMRNSEIGDRVGMTEGSVKWYLQQIYDRIGVRRRSGAIQRARELGLID
ncbi:LuxR C-terminal-related transcriptional regulator [Phreatobacter stygius]|uniref:HTH luxR-type domain-containing protein n=1 Tax=Phreatobacter stygius TaxID=1940610 RepID=A0A4D7BD01_9HYPH|nr:LuxR C-terminal-related transcriptional regulator [Phreatobacter stygius]QCI68473.1 hypothetical protein E8M01_32155 [Phreatobacter stygius]